VRLATGDFQDAALLLEEAMTKTQTQLGRSCVLVFPGIARRLAGDHQSAVTALEEARASSPITATGAARPCRKEDEAAARVLTRGRQPEALTTPRFGDVVVHRVAV
jgi:hypothetical protein